MPAAAVNDDEDLPEHYTPRQPYWWGAALWTFLHRLAAAYPLEPSPAVQQAALSLIRGLGAFLPCNECSRNYSGELASAGPLAAAVTSRAAFATFWLDLHNSVNVRLGRSAWSPAAAMAAICSADATAWEDCRLSSDEAACAEDPVWEVLVAVATGVPETDVTPPAMARGLRLFLDALFLLLEACLPATAACCGFGSSGAGGGAARRAVLASVCAGQKAFMEAVRSAWNDARDAAGVRAWSRVGLETTYCSTVGCGLASALGDGGGGKEDNDDNDDSVLPDPPTGDAATEERLYGERRWSQSPWLYALLITISVLLVIIVALWVVNLYRDTNARRQRAATNWVVLR